MIPDFTTAAFSGRLTSDPEQYTSKGDKVLCRFTVASNKRIGKDSEKTAYMPVLVTGQEGVNCLKYLKKGREVLITGATFETDTWKDMDGNKRKGFTFVVGRGGIVTFGGGGRKSDDADTSGTSASLARDKVSKKLTSDSGL